jgi:hypothetical protein
MTDLRRSLCGSASQSQAHRLTGDPVLLGDGVRRPVISAETMHLVRDNLALSPLDLSDVKAGTVGSEVSRAVASQTPVLLREAVRADT